MTKTALKLAAIAILAACMLTVFLSSSEPSSPTTNEYLTTGMADPDAIRSLYVKWEADYEKNGGDRNLILPLHWSKGLSDQHTKAAGLAKFDLIDGKISVVVKGLPESEGWDFWLIDDRPGKGRTVMPEPGDEMMRVGRLKREGDVAKLEADLGAQAFANFELDLIAVTRAGKSPAEEILLTGNTTLFHALRRSDQRGRFGVIDGIEEPSRSAPERRGLWTRLLDAISPTAKAQTGPEPIDDLITKGRKIFFEETFKGNGRTCGSCHRENNNFTIDPNFISTLDPNDPLFVAEFDPNLAHNFEKPVLMREVGLILENVDGFGNLATKFAMRGVPHTLALPTSINSGGALPGFVDATGWSGDGAPGNNEHFILGDGTPHTATGDLFDFAIGAVRQHFTKRLNRVPGVDFRFPTFAELRALEAFQLSLGRQQDLILPLNLNGPLAKAGQDLFINSACNNCHFNASANVAGGINRNFNTGVEALPLQPGRLLDPTIPIDGGFGATPCTGPQGGPPCGDGTFNTAPVIEAADTGPFFHNNALNTIEGAVNFYVPAFVNFNSTQVQAVAAFLRVLNALENIRSALDLEKRAQQQVTQTGAAELLNLSIAELDDAIEVLSGASLHPDAIVALKNAKNKDQEAINTADPAARNALIETAKQFKEKARSVMVFP